MRLMENELFLKADREAEESTRLTEDGENELF